MGHPVLPVQAGMVAVFLNWLPHTNSAAGLDCSLPLTGEVLGFMRKHSGSHCSSRSSILHGLLSSNSSSSPVSYVPLQLKQWLRRFPHLRLSSVQ